MFLSAKQKRSLLSYSLLFIVVLVSLSFLAKEQEYRP